MRTFGTQGPVNPKDNYVVSRTEEIADFVDRVKKGKYIVLFAPRQSGKTTPLPRRYRCAHSGGIFSNPTEF